MADEQPSPKDGDAINPAVDDCFGPPAEACECFCLHCQRVVNSSDMWYQRVVNLPDGKLDGTWMCPTPNCDGIGFGFDIWPTDPDHPCNEGWSDDDGEFADGDDEGPDAEYDPAEPRYAAWDEDDWADDDLEGEEWKRGLAPGERPAEPSRADDAQQPWDDEQRRYDEPDQRPRTIDGSQFPTAEPFDDGDVPF